MSDSDTPEIAREDGQAAFRRGLQTSDNPWRGAKDEHGKQLSRAWMQGFCSFYVAIAKAGA